MTRTPRPDANPRRPARSMARGNWRIVQLCVGWVIVGFGILIGPLPGPGPVVLVPLGLALVLRNSIWAKRVYIRTKRRHVAIGRWTDWALGRMHHQPFRPRLPSARDMLAALFGRARRS